MAKAKFCNETFIKENSPVNFNVNTKTVTNAIETCQDIYIKNVIGSRLNTEIENQINADNVSTLNSDLLLYYVKPCLLWYVCAELLGSIKINDAGAGKTNTENQESLTTAEYKIKKDEYINKAEYYGNEIRKYLNENVSLFPSYGAESRGDETYPQSNSFHSGMYFPNGIDDCELRAFQKYIK